MMEKGGNMPVILRHDAVTLFQRCFVVGRGHPLIQVIDQCEAGVMDGGYFLHHTDAPVKIG